MALPKMSVPRYTVELPSTGEKLNMRPYLVKEEHSPNKRVKTTDSEGKVVMKIIEGTATDYKSINYLGLIPVLTKAVQEQQEQIETMKTYIELLEERINKLENK